MIYFIVVTILILLLCLVLFIAFLRAFGRFQLKKWTKVRQYFIPTALSLALVLVGGFLAAPRCFDMLDIMRGHYTVETVQIKAVEFPSVLLSQKGARYAFSRLEFTPEIGKTYQIYITPRTHFVVQFLLIER